MMPESDLRAKTSAERAFRTLAQMQARYPLAFVLGSCLVICLASALSLRLSLQLRFEDLLQEKAEQDGGDDSLSQLDASFTLMMLTLVEFLPQLIEALGGEEIPQGV